MTDLQSQLDEARAEMIFREEQLHGCPDIHVPATWQAYDAARDRYLLLLAEARLLTLAEVQS